MSCSQATRTLSAIGGLAIALSFTGTVRGFGEGPVTTTLENFYPGPCVTTPRNLSITYRGLTSGCSAGSATQCLAGEEIVFTATSTDYTFQTCDRFVWTFGDGSTIETFGPTVSHRFSAPGARSAKLRVTNRFGNAEAPEISLPAPLATTCGTGTDRLCLLGNRFRVTLFAETPDGTKSGPGQALPENDKFGFFSIPALTGDAAKVEVFMKMLDARRIGGGFWIFFGGLTDFKYTLTVFDTQTGLTENYLKPANEPSGNFDTTAFEGPLDPGPAPGSCPTGNVTGALSQQSPGTCTTGGSNLCLLNNRFRVTVSAFDPRSNNTGAGTATKKNDQFGYFALPTLTGDPTNAEVVVKLVDASTIGSGFWIFYGALSDLQVTITVTDMHDGRTRTYTRPFQLKCGGFDTAMFSAP